MGTERERNGRFVAADDRRALSPMVGVIVLFGMVAVGAVLVVSTGFVALDAVEGQTAEERSIQTMDQVRQGVEDTQYGQRERFEDVWADEERGSMNVTVTGASNVGDVPNASVEVEMGAFLHESDAGLYASQAGGTWTETDSGSRMIREPTLSHTKTTDAGTEVWSISIPPIAISETEETSGADAVVAGYERADDPIEERLLAELGDEQLEQITIRIEDSPYQDAWARFLEDEFPTERHDSWVRVDGDTLEAAAPLGEGVPAPNDPDAYDPTDRSTPTGGLVTTATDVRLVNSLVDSYDSMEDAYDGHRSAERRHGVIEARGDVTLEGGQTTLDGEVLAGGDVNVADDVTVRPNDEVTGGGKSVTPPTSVADRTAEYVSTVREHSDSVDNADTDAIDGATLVGGTDALETGVYYLEEARLEDELVIDASDGDVVVVVDGDLTIADDVTVLTGDSRTNEVRWFVDGDVTLERGQTVSVKDDRSSESTNDRAPQHWVFGSDDTTTTIGSSASFTGVVYTPNDAIVLENGNNGGEDDRTSVYGALVGDVEGATNAHVAYDRAIDETPWNVGEAGIGGPNHPFDAEVTLAGADFAWNPQIGPVADLFDVFDIFDPGEREDFDVRMPLEGFEHVQDPDHLEYFQAATGTTSVEESETDSFSGRTESNWWEVFSDPSADHEFDVRAGETITVEADNPDTELSLAEPGLLFDDELVSGHGSLEVTVAEPKTLALGIVTDDEREYHVDVERSRHYDEITFNATEFDEFRVSVTSDDSDFYVELREGGEVMQGGEVLGLFGSDARWTGTAGEDVSEAYEAYSSTTSFDGGEGTIRIGSLGSDEPIDYEITLEQSRVDTSFWDTPLFGGGDPPWHQQFPIETVLQFQNETDTTAVQPWPETDLENHSDPVPAHENDVNHPAVEYPLTYAVEDLDPGTMFAPQVTWRDGFCSAMDSYAGSWRTPDSGEYAGETLFEMGCSAEDYSWFGDPDYDMNQQLDAFEYADGDLEAGENGDRIRILEDGDRVPDIEPFEGQHTLDMMLDRVRDDPDEELIDETDTGAYLDLDPGEFVIMFELAPDSFLEEGLEDDDRSLWWNALNSDHDQAPDFNDMVMTFEITDIDDEVVRPNEAESNYHYALEVDDGVITAERG